MHRAQILIEDWQYETLKSISERQGRSVSDLLREILNKHLQNNHETPKRRLSEIQGLENHPKTSGRDHDHFLYGKNRKP